MLMHQLVNDAGRLIYDKRREELNVGLDSCWTCLTWGSQVASAFGADCCSALLAVLTKRWCSSWAQPLCTWEELAFYFIWRHHWRRWSFPVVLYGLTSISVLSWQRNRKPGSGADDIANTFISGLSLHWQCLSKARWCWVVHWVLHSVLHVSGFK